MLFVSICFRFSSSEYIAFMICFGVTCTNIFFSLFISQMEYFMQNMSIEKRVEMPTCDIAHNK